MYNHQLKAFIVAAEKKSFSKAAADMYISTPALIQQINLLESSIGVPLFVRNHSGVTLTKSGESLYKDALDLIKLSDDAKARAINAANLSDPTIAVGVVYFGAHKFLDSVLSELQQKIPNLTLKFVPVSDNISELADTFDIMECIKLDGLEKMNCKFKKLFDTSLSFGVTRSHPLAQKEHLSIKDLDGHTILLDAKNLEYVHNGLEKELEKAGCKTKIIVEPMSLSAALTKCIQNDYLLLMADSYKDVVMNLKMIPLETGVKVPYGLIYRENPRNPFIYQLVSLASEIHLNNRL